MKDVFVIDACALIALLADEEGADKVESILKDAKNGKCRFRQWDLFQDSRRVKRIE